MSRIFITGSTDGLGRAAASTLISEGHEVVLHARSSKRAAALADLKQNSAGIVIGDLSNAVATRAIAARTVETKDELPGSLDETVKQIEDLGAEAFAIPTDLASEEDLHGLIDATVDYFGGVDVLINNAAVTAGRSGPSASWN